MSESCQQVHALCDKLPHLSFPFEANRLPRNGIYILFERGETAHGTNRIVRVGTHTGQAQLPSRLNQHFMRENKDRSIFRKNIGRALLSHDHDPFLDQWEIDLTSAAARMKYAGRIDHAKQLATERRVTEYIQANFHFVVFRVDDKDARMFWESRLISTVSRCQECHPSQKWLGLSSPKEKIVQGGLWQVNELYKIPLTDQELALFQNMLSH